MFNLECYCLLGENTKSGTQKKSKKGDAANIITVTAHGGERGATSVTPTVLGEGETTSTVLEERSVTPGEVPNSCERSRVTPTSLVPNTSEGETFIGVGCKTQMVNTLSIQCIFTEGDPVTPPSEEAEMTSLVGDDFTTYNMDFEQGLLSIVQ